MAEFSESYSCFKPFSDTTEPSLAFLSHLAELSGSSMGNAAGLGAVGYSNARCLPEFSLPFHEGLFSLPNSEDAMPMSVPELKHFKTAGEQSHVDKKRKTLEAPDSASQNCSEAFSGTGLPEVKARNKNSSGIGKKKRSNPKEEEKPKEVVHVRAKRGQATDSHSLAERVRRGKINERMRCLQDLVPGCYKTMGMTGMLDEIINYVQSLQNQVEFLSMKLSAASSFYDYNLDMETVSAAPPQQQVGSSTDAFYIDERRDMVVEVVAGGQQASSTPQCSFDPTFGPWLSPCL